MYNKYEYKMTAIRVTTKREPILDFSESKTSRNYIINKLKSNIFLEFKNNDKISGATAYFNYNIKIGIYSIEMLLSHPQSCAQKDGTLCIFISEGKKEVDIYKDGRFSSELWLSANRKMRLKTSHLASAIILCKRLHNLKAFL